MTTDRWPHGSSELAISWLMLTVVMTVNRVPRLAPHTGLFAAVLVALFITFEAPLSGMSLNPARSFASALIGAFFSAASGSTSRHLSAECCSGVELQKRLDARHSRLCGKLNHSETVACFVRCNCLDRTPE